MRPFGLRSNSQRTLSQISKESSNREALRRISFFPDSEICGNRARGNLRVVYRPLQFQKRSHLFMSADDETLSVAILAVVVVENGYNG